MTLILIMISETTSNCGERRFLFCPRFAVLRQKGRVCPYFTKKALLRQNRPPGTDDLDKIFLRFPSFVPFLPHIRGKKA